MVVFSSTLRIGLFRKRAATGDHSTKQAAQKILSTRAGAHQSLLFGYLFWKDDDKYVYKKFVTRPVYSNEKINRRVN